jgi:DNA-binding NtrC family response regulator
MQILIIDDQAAMRGALELLCDVHGFDAMSAASPQEALAMIRNEDIGLVIQDMNFAEGETSGAEGLASLVCSGGVIRANDLGLPGPGRNAQRAQAPRASESAAVAPERKPVSIEPGDATERAQIQEALERARGVVSKAATDLGVSRQALYRRMERLGLTVTRRVGD